MGVGFRGPSARKFDWDHIFERHSDQGSVALQSPAKTVFNGLTNEQTQARVRAAWRRRSLIKSQRTVSGVERLFYRGIDPKSDEIVMFWYNAKTRIVETAYPVRSSLMKLHTEFDDALLLKYRARGANPIFQIYWEHNGVAYPAAGWTDFGSVILSWWLVAATSLLNGARTEELLFMDGPYRLDVRAINNVYHVTTSESDLEWRVPEETFIGELLAVTRRVNDKFVELGVSDETGMKQGMSALKIAASARKAKAVSRVGMASSSSR